MKYIFYENKNYLKIAKEEKVSTLVAKVIEAYRLEKTTKDSIRSPYDYDKMQDLVGYLLKAINEKKKIVIYGDYDVDGICSVSILKRMFNLLGQNVGYYIPNRYKDGYGINIQKVEEIAQKGYDIIICIDNGINANEAISLAKSKGIDVVVLDHHSLNDKLPECDYYLHPNLSNFVDYNMCASSVAYYLSLALLGKEDEKIAILAGIATISDIMPLVDQNKLIVKRALNLLNNHKYKNFDLLIENKEYDENILSMVLIPKLNSVGRVIKDYRVNQVISFLFEEDTKKILDYLRFINECNEYRKKVSNEFYEKITENSFNSVIIVKNDDLIEGVCGIVASRLANSYLLPAFVFAKSEDGKFYKGSARSIEGINIINVISKLDYLVSFGGHERAAGVTINIEDYDRFYHDMSSIMSKIDPVETSKQAILLEENELTYKNYLELLKYGPFGEGNPYPLFALKSISKEKVSFSKDGKHLLIKLNNEVTLLGFNLANKYQEKYNNYEAIFRLDKNNLIKGNLSCKCEEIIGGNHG